MWITRKSIGKNGARKNNEEQLQVVGSSVFLSNDSMRARYRDSLDKASLVTPGQITRYDFQGFFWFSRRISKGSRLRLVLECVNSMFYEKNYNSGGAVESESGKDSRTAHEGVSRSRAPQRAGTAGCQVKLNHKGAAVLVVGHVRPFGSSLTLRTSA
jgi:hypothetical protein